MAYTFVQFVYTAGTAGQNFITTESIIFTEGNFGVTIVEVGEESVQHATSFTDTNGNDWIFATNSTGFNGETYGGTTREIWYCLNLKGGAAVITAEWTTGGGYSNLYTGEYKPSSTIAFLAANNSAAISVTVAAGSADGINIAGFQSDASPSYSWAGSYNNRGAGGVGYGDEPSVANSNTAAGTGSTGGDSVGTIATFSIAGGGGGGAVKGPNIFGTFNTPRLISGETTFFGTPIQTRVI